MRPREIGVVFEPGLGGRVRAERTMRRWNGWGDEAIDLQFAGEARHFLSARIGEGSPPNDAALDAVVAKIPPSRLPGHRLVSQDRESRLRASVGQSLEDWLRLRFGRVKAVADGVAFPETEDEVREALNFAAAAGAVAIPVGGATSVVGHLTPGDGKRPALAIAMTRLRRLIKLDPTSQLATFEAGVAGPDLEAQLRSQNFVLGHYPQSFEYSTLGGWIATRSCGQQSARYGRIEALFAGGRIVTPTGALDLPAFPASAAGLDLREWVLGSEGRIGVITRATVRVSRAPERETFVGYFLPDWEAGQTATRDLVQMRLGLSMARLANPAETEATLRLAGGGGAVAALERYLALRGCGDGKVLLLIGYTGGRAEIDAERAGAATELRRRGAVSTGALIGAKWRANRLERLPPQRALVGRLRRRHDGDGRRLEAGRRHDKRRRNGGARGAHAIGRALSCANAPVAGLPAGIERLRDLRLPARARLRGEPRAMARAEIRRQRGDRARGRDDHAPARRRQGPCAVPRRGEGRTGRSRAPGDGRPLRPCGRARLRQSPAKGIAMMRQDTLARLRDEPFDALVIGGGITGAGITLECARAGLRTALVEARDYASGASSRTSRLVHGGLRYLAQGDIRLTRESVRDRTELLRAAPGLVKPLGFLLPVRKGDEYGRFALGLGLAAYDFFAGQKTRRWRDAASFLQCAPVLSPAGLKGGWSYLDAETDDARLVLRVLSEARRCGAVAGNRLAVESLTLGPNGVDGVKLCDAINGDAFEVKARCVFNATGAWGDRLRAQLGAKPKLRPLRGSHLLFEAWRLPLAQAIAFFHPDDRRALFAIPWEGSTLVGTTDIDHRDDLDREPGIARSEFEYILRAAQAEFPSLGLGEADVVSTWSGVRPVIASGSNVDPSKERRDNLIVNENGLITVTGGKLTTFRSTAIAALNHAAERIPGLKGADGRSPLFAPTAASTREDLGDLTSDLGERWLARYGDEAVVVKAYARAGELDTIRHTGATLAELRWACRSEEVAHLDDLMLRRTRLGLLLRNGAEELLPQVEAIAREEMGWDHARWDEEVADYRALVARCYATPKTSP